MENIEDVTKRLNEAIAYLKFKGVARSNLEIAEKIEINKSTFSSAVSGNPRYLTPRFLKKVVKYYPEISLNYLVNGFGSVASDAPPITTIPVSNISGSHEASYNNNITKLIDMNIELMSKINLGNQEILTLQDKIKILEEENTVLRDETRKLTDIIKSLTAQLGRQSPSEYSDGPDRAVS